MQDLTFAMIKPHVLTKGQRGEVISRIERAGFEILGLKQFVFSDQLFETFYAEHQGKGFFEELRNAICCGPAIGLVLKHKDGNSIEKWRELIGATNPATRAIGTIRYDYAENMTLNAAHGSDSPASAAREIGLIFPEL